MTTTTNIPPPSLAAAAAHSELKMAIPFGLEGKDTAATLDGYGEIAFAVFARGSVLVLVLAHRCLCQQGRVVPGGGVTVGWWQGGEVVGSGSVEGGIWRNCIGFGIQIKIKLLIRFQRVFL